MKKYVFTGEVNNAGLKRIKRLSDGEIGGWIEGEKNLSQQGAAWVFGEAQVFGNAHVFGDAQVFGNARVSGGAWVLGNARVFGNARVSGGAQLFGNAWVFGDAQVFGNAHVFGEARAFGEAQLHGEARVHGGAKALGNARVFGPIKTATRTDGWTFSLLPCADGVWRISAGCRFFTLDEAWQHWGRGERANTPLGLESEDILVLFEHYIQRQPPLPVYKNEGKGQ